MFSPSVGVYLYQVSLKAKRKKPYKVSEVKAPTWPDNLKAFCASRVSGSGAQSGRRWYFDSVTHCSDGFHAVMQYGRAGFGSRLIDGKTRQLNYDRKTSDIEVIPILSRFWLPKTGSYGIWAFQSFGQYSCNNLVLSEYSEYVRGSWAETILDFRPIIPTYLGSYQAAPVTAVTLKKKASSDVASHQIQTGSEVVNIDVKISPPRGKFLGDLKSLLPNFGGEKGIGREFGGQQYDQAYATIDIGGHTRTVNLYGPARGTGLIDIDKDVPKRLDGHPKRDEFFKFLDGFIGDTVKELGIEQN